MTYYDIFEMSEYLRERYLAGACLSFIGLLIISCSATEMERQFEMEKALDRADRLKQQYHLYGNKLSEAQTRNLIEVYSSVAGMIEPPPDDSAAFLQTTEPLKTSWQIAGLAYFNLGLLKMDLEDYDGAYNDFSYLLDHYGFKPHQIQTSLLMQAIARYRQQRYSDAVMLYNKVAQYYAGSAKPEAPPNLEALDSPLAAARILRERQESSQFEVQIRKAISYYWNIINARYNTPLSDAAVGKLASAFLMGDLADSAVLVLSRVRDPETGKIPPLVLYNIANIQQNNLSDYAAAEKSYRKFIEDYPDNKLRPSAQLGIGVVLYLRKKYRQARDEFAAVEKIRGASIETMSEAAYMTALSYEEEGNWQRALGEFIYARTNYPISSRGMEIPVHIAQYYQSMGETRMAMEAFEEAERDYRRMTDVYSARKDIVAKAMSYIAECYILRKEWELAADELKKIASKYPETPEGYSAYPKAAEILATKLNRPTDAASCLRLFAENYPLAGDIDEVIAFADSLENSIR